MAHIKEKLFGETQILMDTDSFRPPALTGCVTIWNHSFATLFDRLVWSASVGMHLLVF